MPFIRRRDALYFTALRKQFLTERLRPEEARELRRRRLADGSHPLPTIRPEQIAT